jgi:2-keto-4-pentenoate hydratase/2-oxohepta-3-ene-1,7-dioic acid hydratase in catechol pathway
MTLCPGDIILTEPTEGVITGYLKDKCIWLKAGDEILYFLRLFSIYL